MNNRKENEQSCIVMNKKEGTSCITTHLHSGRRGRFPFRGVLFHFRRTGSLLLYGRDELCGFPVAIRYQDGRPDKREAPASGYFGRTDASWYYNQP